MGSKVLFIVPYPINESPSQRFRFEQYLQSLTEAGIAYEIAPFLQSPSWRNIYRKGKLLEKISLTLAGVLRRVALLFSLRTFGLVFIHREALPFGPPIIEWIIARVFNKKVIYDFDDAIWINVVSPNNKAFGWLKSGRKTSHIISYAHLVFAGNEFLANYARRFNSNVAIVPTTIDTTLYRPEYQELSDPVVIGWSGSVSTIEHFSFAVSALKKMKIRYGNRIAIKVIGDDTYRNEMLGIVGLPWKHETELSDLHTIDIGIMPLPDNQWTWGKCGLKGLQYMALGIPTVMSPVGVNREIIRDGENGFLAFTEEDWVEKLSKLVDLPELRSTMGKAGRKTVVENYSVEHLKHTYVGYFRLLLLGK